MHIIILLLAALLVGCNSDDGGSYQQPKIVNEPTYPEKTVEEKAEHIEQQETQNTEVEEKPVITEEVPLRHDFTSISPLYDVPYVTVATEYVEPSVIINIELQRGQLSCTGECKLPITGQTPTGQGSTIFSIDTNAILTKIMINSGSRSSICYEMASGWYVIAYFYRGVTTYKEAQEGCYYGTYEIDSSQWEWDEVINTTVDIRGSSVFTISEIKE